ncbi:MAG TPA: HK97 family phage prohead protease [Burkholderiales bacterium]|nr:HK97 family phage prohead protease [Burkholderiales bacterium]
MTARCEFKAHRFEFKFTEKGPETKGAFEGYASTFNEEDDYGDLILPGAFKKTLGDYSAKGGMPKMLLNHGGLGSWMASPAPEDLLPVGKWLDLEEDSKGLQARGRLINLDTEHGKRIYGAMKEGELDSMSIGYQAKDFTRGTKENEPRRTLKQIHLIEISPVTFPANAGAVIQSVKSIDGVTDFKSAEDFLRDACGFSRSAATAFIGRIKALAQQSESAVSGAEAKQVLAALSRRAELLKP